MLKLKRNVNYKDLKDYGFLNKDKILEYNDRYKSIVIYKKDRRISIKHSKNTTYDVLFDMISDGLIEKSLYNYTDSDKYYKQQTEELAKKNIELQKEIDELKKSKKRGWLWTRG